VGEAVTGGSTDIHKCFDEIIRQLLYALLEAGGFPVEVLTAYRSFHEACMFLNTIAGGLGIPHAHLCGIPQGCPFSMMLIAFLLHPWAAKMRAMGAQPRALADDLLVFATGPEHEVVFRRAYEATLEYIRDIGAKVAPAKCYAFSTVADTRTKLGAHCWPTIDRPVPTKSAFRDLGGHLNFGKTLTGATVNARIEAATTYAHKVARMPWS
jgi:hypothetical protein